MRVPLILALLLVGCGSSDTGKEPSSPVDPDPGPEAPKGTILIDDERLPGFEPAAPEEGEVQIVSPLVRGMEPGADITLCHYFDFEADQDYDITDYRGFQSESGHHVILYAVPVPQPAESHECTETDMLNVRYLAAGGEGAGKPDMPEGIVLRLHQGMQLMAQGHWINATSEVLDGQSVLNVRMQAASDDNIVAGLFTVVTTEITLPAATQASAHAECVVQEEMTYFSLGGHAHEMGRHVEVTMTPPGGAPSSIYGTHWEPHFDADPPRNGYTREEPLVAPVGTKFSVDCNYDNDTGEAIVFPQEMCVMWAYYYPATREINCVNGTWPAP